MKVSAETGAAVARTAVLALVVLAVSGFAWNHHGDSGEFVERLHREAPGGFDGSEFERVTALAAWAYEHTDQAGDDTSYTLRGSIEGDAPEAIYEVFDRDRGAVLCGNTSVALRNLYLELGYRSWVLDMGTPGGMTHVVTLVEVDGRIVVQDAYYGGSFGDVDVREVISAVAGGGRPEWVEGDVEARDYVTAAGTVERVWRVADDADHPLWGGPPDFHRLFLLPLNVTGEGDEALEAELRAAARTGSLPT